VHKTKVLHRYKLTCLLRNDTQNILWAIEIPFLKLSYTTLVPLYKSICEFKLTCLLRCNTQNVLWAICYNLWEISHGYISIHVQKYELQWQEVTYLQLGGFVHLKTVEAGCLYSGMLLGSTGLTSPGLKNKLLCLQKWHQTVKSPSTNTKNAWRPFMCVTTRKQNENCLTQVFLRVRKVS